VGKETTFVTKLFRQANLKIPYRTNNSTEHTLKPKEPNIKYKEHHLSFRNNNTSSKFTQPLLEDGHTFGPMDSIMDILTFNRKIIHLDTTERFYIYREATVNNQFNGKQTICSNKILRTIISKYLLIILWHMLMILHMLVFFLFFMFFMMFLFIFLSLMLVIMSTLLFLFFPPLWLHK